MFRLSGESRRRSSTLAPRHVSDSAVESAVKPSRPSSAAPGSSVKSRLPGAGTGGQCRAAHAALRGSRGAGAVSARDRRAASQQRDPSDRGPRRPGRRHRQRGLRSEQPTQCKPAASPRPRLGHRSEPPALPRPQTHLRQVLLAAGYTESGAVPDGARLQRRPDAGGGRKGRKRF